MKRKWRLSIGLIAMVLLLGACRGQEEVPKKPVEEKEKPAVVTESSLGVDVKPLKEGIAVYEKVQRAIDDGYEPMGAYVTRKGYRFVHPTLSHTDPVLPNGLLYGMNEEGEFVLIGVEWIAFGEDASMPTIYKDISWHLNTPEGGHYADGSFEAASESAVLEKNPVTQAELVTWMPAIYSITLFMDGKTGDQFLKESAVVGEMYDEVGMEQPLASYFYNTMPDGE